MNTSRRSMKYDARVHEDLMKSPSSWERMGSDGPELACYDQLGADGNDGPREAEAMGCVDSG
jgi:hypothetical protein